MYATIDIIDTPINDTLPRRNARGKLRCGLIASPALNVAYCQPSYAQRTLIIARPKFDANEPPTRVAPTTSFVAPNAFPSQSNTALMTRMESTLMIVVTLYKPALCLVPRTWMTI